MRGDDGLRFYNLSGFATKSRPFEYFLTSDIVVDFSMDDSLIVSKFLLFLVT